MIIEKIKIGGFGKFKDFELNLYKGLQVVYGENESGKSTIMDFIMLMFYSKLSGEKAGKRDKEIRQKYLPWDGGRMSGTIEFTYNGEKYLLTKEFHPDSPSKDKTSFKNLSLGEDINLGLKEEVGEKLFGLDLKGFERCGFVKSTGAGAFNSALNKKDSLSDKIFEIVTGQEQENVSERIVIKNLDDSIKDLEKGKGKIESCEKEIYDLKDKIFKTNSQIETQEEYKKQLLEVENKIKEKKDLEEKAKYCNLVEKLNNLKEVKSVYENIENIKSKIINKNIEYEKFLSLFSDIKETKNSIDLKEKLLSELKSLGDNVCSVSQIDFDIFEKAVFQKRKLKDFVFSVKNQEFDKLGLNQKAEEDIKIQIDTKNKDISETEKRNFILKVILAIISLPLIAPGIILKNIFLVFTIFALFSILFFLNEKKSKTECLRIKKEISELDNDLINLSLKNNQAQKLLEKKLTSLGITDGCGKKFEEIFENINKEILRQESKIKNILSKYSCLAEKDFEVLYFESKNRESYLEKFQKIKFETNELKEKFLSCLKEISPKEICIRSYPEGCERYEYIFLKIESLKKLENIISIKSSLANHVEINESNIGNNIFSLLTELKTYKCDGSEINKNEIDRALNILKNEKLEEKYYDIKSKINPLDLDMQELKEQLEQKCEELSKMEHYLKSLKIAKQIFEESAKEIRKNVVPLLDVKASEIFSKLTDNKYSSIHVQKDYNIFINNDTNCSCFSSGTIDQAYLSLRIAMSEIISKDSNMPFFMDDILMQYDKSRLCLALEFLKTFFDSGEKFSQAIIFTCHLNILNLAKDIGCHTIFI